MKPATLAGLAAVLAGVGVAAVRSLPTRVEPDSPAWEHVVRGAPSGRVRDSAIVTFPSVWWTTPRTLVVENALTGGADLGVSIAGRPALWARLPPAGAAAWPLGRQPEQGVRVRLLAREGEELRLGAVGLRPEPGLLRWWVGAAAVSAAAAALIATRQGALALPIVLWLAGVVAIGVAPMRLWLALPSMTALGRLAVPIALLATAVGVAARGGRLLRLALPALMIAAAGFGSTARGYFISSAGSWDVEYWKAITTRVVDHGVTSAYGDPDSVPPGGFGAQLTGVEPAWTLRTASQDFVVDPPPLMMVLWRVSHALVAAAPLDLPPSAAANIAAKLPGVVGDVLATALLAVAFPGRRGLLLAALYWAWPVSWWSSAVLGFFDGAYAPFVLAALLAAAAGRARSCGALVALGALIKATALIAAPAIAIALWRAGGSLARAVAAGLLTVAAFLVPFALDATLQTAVVHAYRVLFQERLSGGFANIWWLLGHWLSVGEGGRSATDVVPYVPVDAIAFPVKVLALSLFAAIAFTACRWLARSRAGATSASLVAATLVLGYGMAAIGVHYNHPHAAYLLLLATGLDSRRLRVLAGGLAFCYFLNLVAMEGLGRFYGLGHVTIEHWILAGQSFRTAPGFDVTLLLAVVQLTLFAWLLRVLPAELQGPAPATGPPAPD